MKVQCPQCKDIVEMRKFSTSEQGLRFRCSACGEISFLANAENLPEEGEEACCADDEEAMPTEPGLLRPERLSSRAVPSIVFEPGEAEVICPKCGHSQLLDKSCHRCGLMFERYDPANLPPEPERAAEIWAQLLADPGDERLHEQFLDSCMRLDRLDYASRQYRMLTRSEAHREKAESMLDRIYVKAQAQIGGVSLVPPMRGEPSKTGKIILWVVFALLAAGAIGYMAYSFHLWSNLRI